MTSSTPTKYVVKRNSPKIKLPIQTRGIVWRGGQSWQDQNSTESTDILAGIWVEIANQNPVANLTRELVPSGEGEEAIIARSKSKERGRAISARLKSNRKHSHTCGRGVVRNGFIKGGTWGRGTFVRNKCGRAIAAGSKCNRKHGHAIPAVAGLFATAWKGADCQRYRPRAAKSSPWSAENITILGKMTSTENLEYQQLQSHRRNCMLWSFLFIFLDWSD